MSTYISRERILTGVALSALCLMPSAPAWAQDAAAPAQETPPGGTAESPATAETIIVTGSRIARPDIQSNVPVAVVSGESIQENGAVNVQDVLQELPQVGIGLGRSNTNFLTTGNGVATINLRNLGTQRTLVLVNGRRFVAGLAADSTVDVNNIPPDFIQRVEVVTGGASAVYGSEAISGVVNFILKDEFEGIQARAQYGITDEGDNPRYLASLTGGTTWGADDRGNVIVNFTYDKDEGLLSRKRGISDEDCDFSVVFTCGPAAYSSFASQGRFQLLDATGTPVEILTDPDGEATSLFTFDKNNNNALVEGFPLGFGFNRNYLRRISTPVERYLGSAILNYDVAEGHEVFAEVTYAKVKSSSQIEPFALAAGSAEGAPDVAFGYAIDNPFIPAPIAAAISSYNAANPDAPITEIGFRRRQNDVFSRSNVNDRDTWRVAAGVRGDIIEGWNYEAAYVFGQLKDNTRTEDLNILNYAQALDAVRLSDGSIVCRSEAARAQGCVPLNLFGENTADPAAAAYVRAVVPRQDRVKNTQHIVAASVTGTLLELPGGDLGVAFGGEYRKEKSRDDWDILTNTGGNAGNITPDTVGSFDVWEGYAEVNVPILSERPFFDYLGLTGAARYSDYSTVGGVFSWNAGAEWAPVNGLRLRGVYAEANRAPNIGELFTAPSETFPTISDPCDGVTATSGGPFADACRAIPGVAAAIAANGVFEYTLADLQGINGFDSGNPDLEEETAKTWTLGAVITPPTLSGLSLTVDYFDIKVDNAIGPVPREVSIEQCLLTSDPAFCVNVLRSASTGFITTVNAPLRNVASFETSGIDVNFRYSRPLDLLTEDRLDLSLLYSYLIKLNQTPFPGQDKFKERGQLGSGASGERLGAGFKHKATARASYSFGGFTASWQVNYVGKIRAERDFDPADFTDDPDIQAQLTDINEVGDHFYHDVQARYAVGEDRNYEFYFGVDNLFDNKPPFIPFPFIPTVTGTETAADTYDPFGRRFYAGAVVRF